jgi:hypothetical protein
MQWLAEDGNPPWVLNKQEEMACQTPDLIVPKLDFKIRYLFTCGSPIGKCYWMGYTLFLTNPL